MHAFSLNTRVANVLFWTLIIALNLLIWAPIFWAYIPTIGLGHDSQLFTPAIHAALRSGNMPWESMTKILDAREDIFSYPYFGLLYPFYWTLGLEEQFSYQQNIILDFASIVFHAVVASITFGYLLIRMGCSQWIAALFGLFYAYSMHLKLWSSWIWAFSGYAWIPLCLLGIWEIVVKDRARIGIFWLGLGFGLITLGTALPLVYALILSILFYLSCLMLLRPDFPTMFVQIKNLLIGGIIGLLIGASHLLPVLFRSADYVRWYSGGVIIGGLKPPYEGTLDQFLPLDWISIGQFFMPYGWFGNVGHLYLGAAIILFAVYILLTDKDWRTFLIPLLVGAIYFYLDAFGDGLRIHRITYQMPLISSVRYPLANVFITIFVLILASALGVNNAMSKKSVFEKSNTWLLSLFTVLLISFLLQFYNKSSLLYPYRTINFWWLLAPVIAVPIALFAAKLFSKPAPPIAIALVLFSTVPQFSMLFHPKLPQVQNFYMSCSELNSLYQNLLVAKNDVGEINRLSTHLTNLNNGTRIPCLNKRGMKLSEAQVQSLAVMAGWNVQQIYISPRALKEYKLLGELMRRSKQSYPALQKAGITHLLTDFKISKDNVLYEFLSLKRNMNGFYIYEVNNFRLGLDVAGCLYKQDNSIFHLSEYGSREVSIPTALPKQGLCKIPASDIEVFPVISNKQKNSSTIQFNIDSTIETTYLSDQIFSKDWKVYINGKKQATFKLDDYRLAFLIPAGTSKISLKHSPTDFMIGKYLTYLGMMLLITLLFRILFIPDKRLTYY